MMQVFNNNFIDEAIGKTASSENAAYPAANAYNIARRRLTWRSNGFWSIPIASSTLVIQDTVGVNLTASVTGGNFTSDTTFFAALKSALEFVSDSTFTISRDSTTKKIKITAVLGGTATVFRIITTNPSSAALADILGLSLVSDYIGALSYIADELRIHTEEYFIFDFGFPAQPTGLVAVSDRNRPLNISPTATVMLYGSPTNNFTSPAETFNVTLRDFLLAYLDKNGIAQLSPSGYRYWKLQIIDRDNPDLYLELGAIFIGAHVQLVRGAPAFPLRGKPVDNSVINESESGQSWVGKKPKTKIHTIGWEKLTNADFDALEAVWDKFGKESSFFIGMDPGSAFSVDGIMWTRLVKFNDDPASELISPSNWSYAWTLKEDL